jgi:hypothetical protein
VTARQQAAASPGPLLDGRYRLPAGLTVPAGGPVTAIADDLALDRPVAITVVPVGMHLAAAEAVLGRVARAADPSLVTLLDAAVTGVASGMSGPGASRGAVAWLVTPVPGAPLSDRLRGAPLPGDMVWGMLASVAGALDALHEADAAHGRLGPSTVVLNPGPLMPSALLAGAGVVGLLAAGGMVPAPTRTDDVAALARLVLTVLSGRIAPVEASRWEPHLDQLPAPLAVRLRASARPQGAAAVTSCASLVAAFEADALVPSPGP